MRLKKLKFYLCFLGVPLLFCSQLPAEELSEPQRAFLEQCQEGSTTKWTFKCYCAAQQYPAIAREIDQKIFDQTVTDLERSCRRNDDVPVPFEIQSEIQGFDSQHPFMDACLVLETYQKYPRKELPGVSFAEIMTVLGERGECKNQLMIRKHALDTCPTFPEATPSPEKRTEFCDCYADYLTQSLLEYKGVMDSEREATVQSQAVVNCRKNY